MSALLKEFGLFKQVFPAEIRPIDSIYIGGGTPSLLETQEINDLLQAIKDQFDLGPEPEITLEANPDDISENRLEGWKTSGINRLSIGVQSFFEEDLRLMNRAHNAAQAADGLELARKYFGNITMDLIYGSPGLSDEKWKKNVEKAIDLDIPHLSCYALTVEPDTPLQKMISRAQRADVDPDRQSAQFLLLMDWLEQAGYEHYEISNFAKPGFRSRHNSSYWSGNSYYGFGPSAHSFDGRSRWWNVSNNNKYIQSIQAGIIPFEREILKPVERLNEYIMISLRTAAGIDLDRISANEWNMEELELEKAIRNLRLRAKEYARSGKILLENNRLKLTRQGKLLADGIAADLFA